MKFSILYKICFAKRELCNGGVSEAFCVLIKKSALFFIFRIIAYSVF